MLGHIGTIPDHLLLLQRFTFMLLLALKIESKHCRRLGKGGLRGEINPPDHGSELDGTCPPARCPALVQCDEKNSQSPSSSPAGSTKPRGAKLKCRTPCTWLMRLMFLDNASFRVHSYVLGKLLILWPRLRLRNTWDLSQQQADAAGVR